MGRLIAAIASVCLTCTASLAQQTQPQPIPDAPSTQQVQTAPAQSNPNALQSSVSFVLLLQDKSHVFPDLATAGGPMTPLDKAKLAANNSVAVFTIGAVAIGAGFGQAINSPSGYHQGVEGYAKRFGANMARSTSGNVFGTFLLASALHQDPRFYVRKNLSLGQSIEYAAWRLLYTQTDSGERQINYSGLIGPLMGEGLANAYYPQENRTAGATFTRFGSDMAWRFGGNLLRQYWPEINRKLRLAPDQRSASK
jgi:hypothetical protein